jgi:hypothetical protein
MKIIEIRPVNNKAYVDERMSEWLVPERFSCPCNGHDNHCIYCEGTGVISAVAYPYTLRLDLPSFTSLWSTLQLTIPYLSVYDGAISGNVLLQQLKSTSMTILTKPMDMVRIGNGIFIGKSVSVPQMEKLIDILTKIATEALRRKVNVEWKVMT